MTEGLPQSYDAAALQVALQALSRRVAALEGRTLPSAAPAGGAGRPGLADATVISAAYSGSTYGATPDPRLGVPAVQRLGRVVGGAERFRIGRGLILPPLMTPPVVAFSVAGSVPPRAPTSNPIDVSILVFGMYVAGIPHQLGRVPTWMRPVAGCDDMGPVGQLLKAGGGTKLSGNLFCDVDFIPLFGRTPEDIELAAKHMVGFAGAGATSPFQLVSLTKLAYYENTNLPRDAAARMVTTDKLFSGLLLTTAWGLNAFQWSIGQTTSGGAAYAHRYGAAPLFKSGWATVLDEHVRMSAPLPWIGKSMAGVLVDKDAPITLNALLADGTRAFLSQGSVEWEMG